MSLVFCLAEERCLFNQARSRHFRDARSISVSPSGSECSGLSRLSPFHRDVRRRRAWVLGGKARLGGWWATLALNWVGALAAQPLGEQDLRSFGSFPGQAKRQIPKTPELWASRAQVFTCQRGNVRVSPSSALHLLSRCHVLKMAPAASLQEALHKFQLSTHNQFCYGRKGAPLSQYLHLAKPYPQAEWALLIYLFIFPEMNTECLLWEAEAKIS